MRGTLWRCRRSILLHIAFSLLREIDLNVYSACIYHTFNDVIRKETLICRLSPIYINMIDLMNMTLDMCWLDKVRGYYERDGS